MIQNRTSDNKIKENKYKILRMSLLLGSDDNREETLNNFEDAAREIDAMNDEVYLRDLQKKFYDTTKLEDEEKKLDVLVNYIEGRVEQRISLLTDFSNVTGFDLQDLPPIQYYDKLDDYKERLGYIREYLSNVSQLAVLNKELQTDKERLDNAYQSKTASEEFNQRNEDMLFNKFQHIIKSVDSLSDISKNNVEECYNSAVIASRESQKSLDIFTKSYTTLLKSGISDEEKKEYYSYVTEAQVVYYDNKEKEYLLRLYQLLLQKESNYNDILVKRDAINDLLYERLNLRQEFGISGTDVLSGLYDVLEKQYQEIQRQKENIDMIDRLNESIQQKNEQINELEVDNQKVEILALLREYGVIDTYSSNEEDKISDDIDSFDFKEDNLSSKANASIFDTPLPAVEDKHDNEDKVAAESVEKHGIFDADVSNISNVSNSDGDVLDKSENIFEGAADNQVVCVEDAKQIDLDLVHSKANKVMQRVGEMLGIKPKEDKVVSVTSDTISAPSSVQVTTEVQNNVPENPLFSNDVQVVTTNTSTDSQTELQDTSDSNDFWFPSETPDALNELPDLEVSNQDSNNFFNNNPMPDLNFPDLKLDTSSNGEA